MSLTDKRWAQKARQAEFDQLTSARQRAEQWRNGLVALTALLTAVTIIKGPDSTSKLSNGTRVAVVILLGVAFLALVGGCMVAMRASFGWPAPRALLTGDVLRDYERNETDRISGLLPYAAILLVAGVLLTGVATGLVLLSHPNTEVLIQVSHGTDKPTCGVLQPSDDKDLTVGIDEGYSSPTPTAIPWSSVTRLEAVSACNK